MLRAVRGPLLIIVLIVLLLAGLWLWIRTSLPTLEGALTLPGLAEPVAITRDSSGVPLIEAESQEDLYYALGFVHAQDRLWQMEHRRMKAAGRLAELLGGEALPSDLLMRTLGLQQAAQRDVARLSARASGVLQAYSDGVNAFLEHRSGALPLEFQLLGHTPAPWAPVDVAMLQKLTTWEQSDSAAGELFRARLAARLNDEELALLLGSAQDGEIDTMLSNNSYSELPLAELHALLASGTDFAGGPSAWAIGPEHTADNVPLLAFEGYGPLSAPAPWYLVRLRAPGFAVAGATLPGMPLVFSGRNEQIAWTLVPTQADTQDLVVERPESRPRNGAEGYRTAEGWQEFETRHEVVVVRGGEDISLTVRETVHGPVISGLVPAAAEPAGGEELIVALRWTALAEEDRTLQAVLDLALAGSWEGFRAALLNLDEYHGTALYADTEGRIGWQQVGRRPEREAGQGDFPVPGWTGRFEWDGWLPFGRLEKELDPAEGRIVVSGTGATATGELLATLDSHTATSSARLLGREHLAAAETLLSTIRSAIPSSELARRAHAQLLGWGGELDTRGPAPLIFSAWLPELAKELLADELGEELAADAAGHPQLLQLALADGDWCDDRRSDEVEVCTAVSSQALTNAVAALAQQHGEQIDEWPPIDRARLSYRHPVFEGTLLARAFRVTPAGEEATAEESKAEFGPTFRAVFELAADDAASWGASGFLIPTGQSGNPLSPYYRNFAQRWREVELLPLLPEEPGEGEQLLLEPRR